MELFTTNKLDFSTTLLPVPTVGAYLHMLTQKNTKYLSLPIPLSKEPHLYSGSASEAAET